MRLLAALLLLPTLAAAQDDVPLPRLSAGRVAGQVGAAAVAGPIGFVAGGLAVRGVARALHVRDDRASLAGSVGAWTTGALTTAAGAALVGARGPGRGSYPAAVGGAVAGGLGSWLIARVNERLDREGRPCHARCIVSAAAVVLLPSVGATVAYDASRAR